MGGHSAWRKRVERGELAKGLGGAIMRHRPHFGRKGKDLIKNRKGHIGGGNPKKQKKVLQNEEELPLSNVLLSSSSTIIGKLVLATLAVYGLCLFIVAWRTSKKTSAAM